MEVLRNIGPSIDLQCSGINLLGNKIYRVFNSLFEIREHYRTKHNKIINKNTIITNYKNNNFKLILKNIGSCNEHYYIEEEYIKNIEGIIPYDEYISNKKDKEKKHKNKKSKTDNKLPNIDNNLENESDIEDKNQKKKRNMKNTRKIINFIPKFIKEKKIQKDFIDSLEINYNKFAKNINDKILPKEICKGIEIDINQNIDKIEKYIGDKNFYFNVNTELKNEELYNKHRITQEKCRLIGPCICSECSGINKNGIKLYKLCNSLEELKTHCSSYHQKTIPLNSIMQFEINNNFTVIQRKTNEYFLIENNNIPKIDKEYGYTSNDIEKYLRIIGWNCNSLCTPTNKALINAYLEKHNTDIIMLNECGEFKNKKIIKNKEYKICSFSNKIGIIYNKKYSIFKILENLNDEYNLISLIDSKNEYNFKYILYCVYLPPNDKHNILIDDFLNKVNMIYNRYKNCKLIIFGDFNLTRKEFKNKIEKKLGNKFNYHYRENENNFTRYRITYNNKIESSYIDYFITLGFDKFYFDINFPIGKSDHFSLELYIQKEETKNLIIQKEIIWPYNRIVKDSKYIANVFYNTIKDNNINDLSKMIKSLYNKYKPKIKKMNKGCIFLNKIDKYNNEFKNNQNFENFHKYIIHMSKIEYSSFIKMLSELNINKMKKEYFLKLRFYSNINKNTDILKNLEIQFDDDIKIETNKDIIDNLIRDKYIKMLKDNGYKEKYDYKNNFIVINSYDLINAINTLNTNKAISFDYIPGKIFDILKQNKEKYYDFIYSFTKFLNKFLYYEKWPEEILTSRLFCINKVASIPGTLDNIRPIAIFGPIFKILEKCILEKLILIINNNNILCKNQTGFIPKLGCEINLARLKQKVYDVMNINNEENKYIFFIDIKNAYDSVNHIILFEKMKKYKISETIINTIMKIYTYAKMKINLYHKSININRGVLQGSILSPMLFNIYINDLIKEIKINSYEVLAYADDIAVICSNHNELIKVMKVVENWAKNNDMNINKKKSGILIIKGLNNKIDNINEYPIKNTYKYLGITINNNLDPMAHIYSINRKLSDYLKRNNWLIKKYFSPKTLIQISNYYQISRITYGMCIYLDNKKIMDSIEKARLKYFKSIINIKDNIKSNLIRLVLCLPKMEYLLYNRLLNVVDKYKNHFGENITIFNNILKAFNKRTNAESFASPRLRYITIKNAIIIATAKQEKINIGHNYINYHYNHYFKYPDKRDLLIIRFYCNYGFFNERLLPSCVYCGKNNSRKHIMNECNEKYFIDLRKKYINKIKKIKGIQYINNNNFEQLMTKLYFEPDQDIKKILLLIKEFVADLYINRPKKDNEKEY